VRVAFNDFCSHRNNRRGNIIYLQANTVCLTCVNYMETMFVGCVVMVSNAGE